MFRIGRAQLEALDDRARADFHVRLERYIREAMPDEAAEHPGETLRSFITQSDRRARGLGIETEAGIAQWVCLALVVGLDFDEDPDLSRYFDVPGTSSETKLEILVDGLNAGFE